MERNNLQLNPNNNPSFVLNFVHNAEQQQAHPQAGPFPPLGNVSDLSAHPSARNLGNYRTNRPLEEELDTFNLPEYQPVKPGELYLEKLVNEDANTQKMELLLKHAREHEERGNFQYAKKNYKNALKYTESAEHYKLYAACLKKINALLKDEAKKKIYKERAAKAFYYLGELYVKQGAWEEAQTAYRTSSELACHEVPLQALVAIAQRLETKGGIVDALVKLTDFYTEKGRIDLAIDKLEEAFKVLPSVIILEKLETLYEQAGGEDNQSKLDKTRIHRFELQINEDPKNISIYRKYAWFLKDIGKRNEARTVKERMDGLLQQNIQTLQHELLQTLEQKILKQKTKIGDLKQTIHLQAEEINNLQEKTQTNSLKNDAAHTAIGSLQKTVENLEKEKLPEQVKNLITVNTQLRNLENKVEFLMKKASNLDFRKPTNIKDEDLRSLFNENPYIKSLNLNGCKYLTGADLASLKGLKQLTTLNLNDCERFTDAGIQHMAGLTQLTTLYLASCNKLTDAGLQHLTGLTQLTALGLSGCTQLTDAGIQYLAGLTKLRWLNLSRTQLTDAGIQHLLGLTNLTTLYLSNCNDLSENAKEKLKKQIPRLTIHG